MAHFSKIKKNKVIQVIVVRNEDCNNLNFPESEAVGQEFIASIGLEGTWKQTSYNNNFRKNYAGVGYTYDEELDAFIPPKPAPSFIFDKITCRWKPPIPYPQTGRNYTWDEKNQSWIEVNE